MLGQRWHDRHCRLIGRRMRQDGDCPEYTPMSEASPQGTVKGLCPPRGIFEAGRATLPFLARSTTTARSSAARTCIATCSQPAQFAAILAIPSLDEHHPISGVTSCTGGPLRRAIPLKGSSIHAARRVMGHGCASWGCLED